MHETEYQKLNKILGTIACAVGSGSIAIYSLLTIAAFNSVNQNNFAVNYKTESIGSSYFDGGSGTATNAYKISNAQQLRNLQELNALGFFNSTTNFALENDITWDDATKPLLPIGSDDQPFDGVFDGCGHTITNLVVNGSNTWDVGMFGYVSITGTLKNFFLEHPTVNVTPQDGGGTADTTNPLAAYFKTAAQQLPNPAKKGSSSGLTWTNNSAGNSSTITGTQSSVSAAINGKTVTYAVDWQSSDTTLLSPSGTNWVTHATATDDNPTVNLHPVMLTARIYGNVDGRVMPYCLERYEVNVLGNGLITDEALTPTINGSTVDSLVGIFKTIWPTYSSGTVTDYHGTYVGFFAGHIDGFASCLGLVGGNYYDISSNGAIIVSGRVAQSSSSLVGRTRDDDIAAGSDSRKFGHTFDFTKAPRTTYTTIVDAPTTNHGSDDYLDYCDFGNPSTSYGQIPLTTDFTKYYLTTAEATNVYKYMRNYPQVTLGRNVSYTIDNPDGTTSTATAPYTVQMTKPLRAAAASGYYPIGFSTTTSSEYANETTLLSNMDAQYFQANPNVVRSYSVSNGFWVYTKGDSSDTIKTLTGQNEFSLTFNITYVATTPDGSTNTDNSWQIMYNAWNADGSSIRSWQPTKKSSTGTDTGFWYKMSTLQNCLWYDLSTPYHAVDVKDPVTREHSWEYQPIEYGANEERQYTPVTIIADGHRHIAHVKVTVKQGSGGSFLGSYYSSKASTDIWYPCFAIGMGVSGQWNCNHYLRNSSTSYSDATLDATGITNVHKQIKVWDQPYLNVDQNTGHYSDDVMKSQRGLTTGRTPFTDYDDNTEYNDFFNSYYSLSGNITMNILSFQSVFTNANGNVSDLLNNVDYIYSKGTCTYDSASGTFTTWNDASDVKVGFNVNANLTSGNAAYYFYRSSGSSPLVGVSYNNSTYAPTNGADHKEATLTAL
jgi:hypothetical protein